MISWKTMNDLLNWNWNKRLLKDTISRVQKVVWLGWDQFDEEYFTIVFFEFLKGIVEISRVILKKFHTVGML